jgi:hypothetical protein
MVGYRHCNGRILNAKLHHDVATAVAYLDESVRSEYPAYFGAGKDA